MTIIEYFAAAVLTGDIFWLLVPFCSTSLGRLLSA